MIPVASLPPQLDALAPGVQQQVMAMLAVDPCLGVAPLPGPPAQSAMPPGATRFALEFQYCLERVRWTVIMQRLGAALVPDFLFSESTFMPLVPGSGAGGNAQQLADALSATGQPQQLARVVSLLLQSYAAHHAKRVEVIAATDDQLQFELDTTAAEGRQVMLQNPAGASAMKVVCVLPVPGIQLASLLAPPQLQPASAPQPEPLPESPDESSPPAQPAPQTAAHAAALAAQIRLKVLYTLGPASSATAAMSYAAMAGGGRASARTPQLLLHLPPELWSLLGKAPALPPWTSGMCLMEFLPATAEAMQAAVDRAAAARSARHALFHAISGLAGAPLLCDTAHYWKATWRVEIQGLVCLLYVAAGAEFPERMPELTLQVDGAGFDESRPFVRYSEYGWSPRWQPTEGAQRIFAHLEDTAPQWKAHLQPPQLLPISGLPPQEQHQPQQAAPAAASPAPPKPSAAQRLPAAPDLLA